MKHQQLKSQLRSTRANLALALITLSFASCAPAPRNEPMTIQNQKPNIVLMFVDDLAWMDIKNRSGFIETPNIDRLSKQGISFERAYSPAPVCSPSRVGLITGQHPAKFDFFRHVGAGKKSDFDKFGNAKTEYSYWPSDPAKMPSKNWLPLEAVTLAERLKEVDYATHFVGKWHSGHSPYHPIKQGFDTQHGVTNNGHPKSYYPPYFKNSDTYKDAPKDKYLTDRVTDDAVKVITEQAESDSPFFLSLWWYGVHRPTVGQKENIGKYLAKGVSREQAEYATQVEAIDNSVARVEAALEAAGKTDNTIVIFTSDQGGYYSRPPLTGRKGGGLALYEGGARVPLVVKWPREIAQEQSSDTVVSLLDIAPTLMTAAGADKSGLDGVNLVKKDKTPITEREPVILYRHYEDEYAAVIDGPWKLIARVSGRHALYNTITDVSEVNDVASAQPARVEKMITFLENWKRDENIRPFLK